MEKEVVSHLDGKELACWESFLESFELQPDHNVEQTVLLWDEDHLIAAGSRQGNVLKCFAVDPTRQGEGLTATVLTALRQEAFAAGYRHLFLYTKPANKTMFESLFFHPVAQTDTVLLMEDRANGIQSFVKSLPRKANGDRIGAAVMNCNPFTRGHRYLVETAAAECDHLYLFVLSEDKSRFSAADRLEMVKRGVADLENVTVLTTGPYLISSATFPTYFLKEREQAEQVHCLLDIEIFVNYFVPALGITHRFVGTEPLSQMTDQYNTALRTHLPPRGIVLREIPRLEQSGTPISASAVRRLLDEGNLPAVEALVPPTTFAYLQQLQQEV